MRIYGNANVTNLIHVTGRSTPARNDYGIIQNVQLDGVPATFVDHGGTIGLPTANQIGIFMDGGVTYPMYFWKLNNIDFRGLDIGLHCFGFQATSTQQDGITADACNVGEKLSGGQHLINNCWFQGYTNVGQYGLWLYSGGSQYWRIIQNFKHHGRT